MVMSLGDEVVASLEESVEAPKRVGRMEEFAHACAFLIENSYMNGAMYSPDNIRKLAPEEVPARFHEIPS